MRSGQQVERVPHEKTSLTPISRSVVVTKTVLAFASTQKERLLTSRDELRVVMVLAFRGYGGCVGKMGGKVKFVGASTVLLATVAEAVTVGSDNSNVVAL